MQKNNEGKKAESKLEAVAFPYRRIALAVAKRGLHLVVKPELWPSQLIAMHSRSVQLEAALCHPGRRETRPASSR